MHDIMIVHYGWVYGKGSSVCAYAWKAWFKYKEAPRIIYVVVSPLVEIDVRY